MAKYEIVSPKSKGELTIDSIAATLMRAKVLFHILHINTKSFAKHKALEELYEEVTDMGDDIIETLLGREETRLGNVQIESMPAYSDNVVDVEVDNLHTFSEKLFNWATSKNYQDTANLAAELQQLCNKTKYRLTLD